MIARFFHEWERRLATETNDRIIRKFEWGLDWIIDGKPPTGSPYKIFTEWVSDIFSDTNRFFSISPTDQYDLNGQELCFPSAIETPHLENNTVYAKYFPAVSENRKRRAVIILPQWNADINGHITLSRLIARTGISSLRLSLPYHDRRMPPELNRADYIVSSNVGRTLQICRQAVLDARRAVDWLTQRGYKNIGILGTSLGSCLAMLTAAHEPRISVAALNHISPYFADVVWEGLSTTHVRAGLNEGIELDQLRLLWLPISPEPYIERMRNKKVLLVYARYDLSFPLRLSRELVDKFRLRLIPHQVVVLPCGHYSTGIPPFSWMDGYALIRFLHKNL